jgi:hypothetical protein
MTYVEWLFPVGLLAVLILIPLLRGANEEVGGARGWGRIFGGRRR